MKLKFILGVVFCIILSNLSAQVSDSINQKIIGKWNYIKTIDKENNSVEYIIRKYPGGTEMKIKTNGPKIIINKNGTYSKQFTEENIDTGNWKMKSENEIEYEMVIPKNSRQGKLIAATQKSINKKWRTDKNGNFLDASTNTILSLSKSEMTIEYEKDYVMIFKREAQ